MKLLKKKEETYGILMYDIADMTLNDSQRIMRAKRRVPTFRFYYLSDYLPVNA